MCVFENVFAKESECDYLVRKRERERERGERERERVNECVCLRMCLRKRVSVNI
jgi:hypothetical protein